MIPLTSYLLCQAAAAAETVAGQSGRLEIMLQKLIDWSLNAGAQFNPFTFRLPEKGKQLQSRQQSYELGVRLWPWHIFSGWWIAGKAKYQEYNRGGLFSQQTEEGDGFGIGLSAGYSYMIHPNLNLEFGIGLWSGIKKYAVYDCPSCGLTTESGTKGFIMPNELLLSLVYVF